MKIVAQWRTETKDFEDFLPLTSDVFQAFIEQAKPYPCFIKLKDGTQLRGILLEGSFGALIALQTKWNPKPEIAIIRTSEIVSIACPQIY